MIVEEVKIQTSESTRTVKELRKELKDLKDQLLSTQKGTEEYSQAMQKAANIQHELKEQMQEINNSAMDFGHSGCDLLLGFLIFNTKQTQCTCGCCDCTCHT